MQCGAHFSDGCILGLGGPTPWGRRPASAPPSPDGRLHPSPIPVPSSRLCSGVSGICQLAARTCTEHARRPWQQLNSTNRAPSGQLLTRPNCPLRLLRARVLRKYSRKFWKVLITGTASLPRSLLLTPRATRRGGLVSPGRAAATTGARTDGHRAQRSPALGGGDVSGPAPHFYFNSHPGPLLQRRVSGSIRHGPL